MLYDHPDNLIPLRQVPPVPGLTRDLAADREAPDQVRGGVSQVKWVLVSGRNSLHEEPG